MEKVKYVIDELNVREICLDLLGVYVPAETNVENENGNITITMETEHYYDKIYGREIQGKYYFARVGHIQKNFPVIDFYDEFFSNGVELKLM